MRSGASLERALVRRSGREKSYNIKENREKVNKNRERRPSPRAAPLPAQDRSRCSMSSLPSLPVFSSSTSASSEVLLGRTAMSLSKRTMISSGVRPLRQRLSAAEG